jgi:hypothetical protein
LLAGCSVREAPPAQSPTPLVVVAPTSSAAPAPPPGPLATIPLPGWRRFQGTLELLAEASSEYPSWPASNLLDGDPTTSWFSDTGDSVAKGKAPWVRVQTSRPVRLRQVTVLGNRSPPFPVGYSALKAHLLVLGEQERELAHLEATAAGPARDFTFTPKTPLDNVRAVRLEVLQDEGDRNPYGDVALGEILVEIEEEKEDPG